MSARCAHPNASLHSGTLESAKRAAPSATVDAPFVAVALLRGLLGTDDFFLAALADALSTSTSTFLLVLPLSSLLLSPLLLSSLLSLSSSSSSST